jgi:hypothetical protein
MLSLHVLTTAKPPEPERCTEDYVCRCVPCELERAALVARGVRPDVSQPWQSRKAA